ncbi:MAG: hypothetical protein K2Q22_06740, partial [Cytophagales bacterium]|nr:hypothetical protein [Cytophagales bacterium]
MAIFPLSEVPTTTSTPSGSRKAIYRNGRLLSTNNNLDYIIGKNSSLFLGGDNNFSFFNGDIAEFIVLNSLPSALDQRKIQSYLALKYGITLDQTTPSNYIASDGTTLIWNAAVAGTYKNNIAGIGRDDNSGLNQKQSKSNVSNELVSIGLGTIAGTNQLNPNTISSNLSFLSWSHNNGSTLEQATELPTSGGGLYRIGREWLVQETGTISGLQVVFDLSLLTVSGTQAQDFSLLVDSDGDGNFSTGNITSYLASSLSSNQLVFDNVNFSNGDYFTISTFRRSPGGVSGAFLWLDATRGISGTGTVSSWADQSGNVKDMTNGINSNPVFNANAINFNPSVDFDGAVDYMTRSTGILGTSIYSEFNTYIVSRTSNISNTQIIAFEATNNTGGTPKFSIQLPTNTGVLQYDVGNGQSAGGGRVSANWGGNTSNFYLWSLNSSIGTSTPSGSQKAIYSNGLLLGSNVNAFSMRGNNSPFYLGSFSTSPGVFNGQLSEMILVNKTVSGFEQKKIESYLAIKYGITLSQVTPTNYIASNGSVIWDATAAGTYSSNIAGVGRDDISGLLQKQSKSNSPTEILTIGLGTIAGSNALNTSSISSDLSFMVWGNNNGSNAEQSTECPPSLGILKRIGKEWKIAKTGTFSSAQVNLDLSTLTVSGTTFDDFNLLIDSDGDGDFTTGTIQTLPATTIVGNVLTFQNISFNDGDVFTFSTFKSAPGGVRSGLNLWLKATNGVFSNNSGTISATEASSVQFWYDFSLNQNHAVKGGTTDPTYRLTTNLINFNPSVFFNNSTNQYFNVNLSSLKNSGYTLYGSLIRSSNNSENYFLGTQSITTNQGLHIGYRIDTDIALDQYGNGVDQAVPSYASPISPAIVLGTSNLLVGKSISEYRNSSLSTMSNGNIQALTGTAPGVVGRGFGINGFLGDLTEVVVYNRNLSSLEIQKVNSYLAIKNGISLPQSSPTSYLASTGTAIWNATIAGSYKFDIAGIGRDDAAGLNQKQSKSANSDEIVTIGLGTIALSNSANANSFSSDLSFQIWANDNGSLAEQITEIPVVPGCLKRLGREWKVDETGTVGNCQISLNLSSLTVTGTTQNDFNLLVDQDGDGNFTTGVVSIIPATTLVSNVVTFSSIDLSDGQVFTFTTSSVTSASIGGTISSPSLLQCISGNSGTLTLSGYNGSILQWESSTNNFATTQTITNTAFTNAFSNLTANTSFRARVQNSVCPSTTSGIITLTTVGVSVGGSISGINSPYCTGSNSGTLTLSGIVGNVLLWQSSSNNFSTVSTISNTAFTQSFTNLTTTTGYRALVQNSVCPSTISGSFTVSVVGLSVGGTVAGPNVAVCAGVNSGTLTLSGIVGNIQKWQSSANNFATVTDISSVTSTLAFSNLTTTTSYRAIVQNGLCSTVASAAFTITVNGISVGGTVTGPNTSQCSGANSGILTVAGFSGNIVQWQSSPDNFATLSVISSTTSTVVFNNLTTTTSFRAIVQNGVCSTVASSAFTVTVNGISVGGTVTGPN